MGEPNIIILGQLQSSASRLVKKLQEERQVKLTS